ncbi:hypothetical protein L596_021358 [Steinernema carpocapsae]|uniref:Uncharacterized protein n=1 Tax=Steinernema carpocapsae TaxID=34508 RepID=A0A4U5MIG7_STECR|nr:hypothetical protein L596_021358 [Steinernema carpocapsae]
MFRCVLKTANRQIQFSRVIKSVEMNILTASSKMPLRGPLVRTRLPQPNSNTAHRQHMTQEEIEHRRLEERQHTAEQDRRNVIRAIGTVLI